MARITSLSNPGAALNRLLNPETSSAVSANLVVSLPTPAFLGVWFGIVALHSVCGVYLTQLARVYWFLKHPRMEFWSKLATGDRYIYLRYASIVWGLIAALHYWQLLCILWATLRARALAFPDNNSSATWNMVSRLSMVQSGTNRLSSITTSGRYKKLTWPSRIVMGVWRFFFSRHGVFGIESHLFHVVFTVRELVEIVSQTFQAHRSSEQLPRPWLNNFLVTLVVMNCWSTPVLQHVFRRHQGKERVVCLLLDAMLNIGLSMVVPLAVFWPYYKSFDHEAFLFPVSAMYDDIWYSKFTMEVRLLFSMSTPDMFSKLVPHLGIYASIASATTLVCRLGAHAGHSANAVSPAVNNPRAIKTDSDRPRAKQVNIKPASAPSLPPTQLSTSAELSKSTTTRRKRLAVHTLFFVWGLVVLVLHLHAVTRLLSEVPGCRQPINSWFASGYPCSVYNYNCHRQGVTSPSEDSWTHLDTRSLSYLGISHCSELRMPRYFQSFPGLGTLTLHNVTVFEWNKESAISATKHPELSMVLAAHFNATGLPDGILEPLPTKLVYIEFSDTNFTTLPDNLHTRWHAIASLFFENSLFTEFPKTLLSLPFTKLSLHGNPIERLPELSEKHWHVLAIAMNANPIKELPDNVMDDTAIQFLSLEGSQITTLPAWIKTNVKQAVYLYDTPYCAQQVYDTYDGGVLLACVKRDERATGKIPLPFLDALFPV